MERAAKPAPAFFSQTQRKLFETIPQRVQVFRGCSLPRVLGIAWTIRRDIAEGFARGHRNIRLPEPVVTSALIPKEHIFFVTDDREEKEIILNPRRLSKLVVEAFEHHARSA
jgi:hypothetical protein